MDKPVEHYWRNRLDNLKETLEANNFEVFVAETADDARRVALEEILPKLGAKSVPGRLSDLYCHRTLRRHQKRSTNGSDRYFR